MFQTANLIPKKLCVMTIFVTVWLVLGLTAHADGLISEIQLYHGTSKSVSVPSTTPDESPEVDQTANSVHLSLGYLSNSLFLGGLYSIRSDVTSDVRSRGVGFGAGIGYFFENGIRMRAFYRFNEEYGDFTSGDGVSADLGIWGRFYRNISIGLVIHHATIHYARNSSPTITGGWTANSTYPMLSVGYHFQ